MSYGLLGDPAVGARRRGCRSRKRRKWCCSREEANKRNGSRKKSALPHALRYWQGRLLRLWTAEVDQTCNRNSMDKWHGASCRCRRPVASLIQRDPYPGAPARHIIRAPSSPGCVHSCPEQPVQPSANGSFRAGIPLLVACNEQMVGACAVFFLLQPGETACAERRAASVFQRPAPDAPTCVYS